MVYIQKITASVRLAKLLKMREYCSSGGHTPMRF